MDSYFHPEGDTSSLLFSQKLGNMKFTIIILVAMALIAVAHTAPVDDRVSRDVIDAMETDPWWMETGKKVDSKL